MYGIGGERDLTERTLDHLSGYQGARPVRVGNGAWNQQQHDVWGMILDALDVQFRRAASQIVSPAWEGLAGFVDAALEHWREPDQGIWEVRGEPKHFTASKVMCWVAAARGADLAEERGDEKRAQRWRAGADTIKAEVLDKGISSRGVFRQHYKTDGLDASLLLLAILGFLPPDDDRIRATVLAIAGELTQDGLDRGPATGPRSSRPVMRARLGRGRVAGAPHACQLDQLRGRRGHIAGRRSSGSLLLPGRAS
jgi:GH15 family glucan-1,4-alpha-glucosidase